MNAASQFKLNQEQVIQAQIASNVYDLKSSPSKLGLKSRNLQRTIETSPEQQIPAAIGQKYQNAIMN